MTTTITTLALSIYTGACEAGATRAMLLGYDLTREDCEWIRDEYLGASDASEVSEEEYRQTELAVEREVRSIAAADPTLREDA